MSIDVKSLNDEELVELVRSKDQEYYNDLVLRYQDKLLRYVNYLVSDRDKSADIVQEAFIKAFVNLRGFNEKKKFSSWIYRIAHNETINYVKKYKKEVSLDEHEFLKEIPSHDNPAQEFEKKESKEMLQKSLEKLPMIYREPLALFFLEEQSYNEISDILRMPLGTLSTRISRGKKIMKKVYEKDHNHGK